MKHIFLSKVMNGWAKSAESGCGERAQAIYELALEQYEKGDVDAAPNSFMYSALIGKSLYWSFLSFPFIDELLLIEHTPKFRYPNI